MIERYLMLALCTAMACTLVQGQTPADSSTRVGSHTELKVDAGYDANALRNELVDGILFGGYLDRPLRQRTADALTGHNRGGYEAGIALHHVFGKARGKWQWRPRLALAGRSFLGMRFTEDAYGTAFFGNAPYMGTTAQLGPAALEHITYATLGVGADLGVRGHVVLSVVGAHQLTSMRATQADLYTAPHGSYLELDIDGRFSRSDSTTGRTPFAQGFGLALSGAGRLLNWGKEKANSLYLEWDDLGFVHWGARSLSTTRDSVIRYEGIHITDLQDLSGLGMSAAEVQDSLGLGFDRGAFTRPLPGRVGVRLLWGGDAKHRRYELSAEMRAIPGYIPLVAATRSFLQHSIFRPELRLAYGGFGGFRVGGGVSVQLGDRCGLRMELPNLVGMVSDGVPGRAVGIGLWWQG